MAVSGKFSVDDYAGALRSLLPRGRAWPETTGSIFGRLIRGMVGVFARADTAAVRLLKDGFPIGTVDLLPEWEATLGLPDPCAGPSPTIAQRQAAVHARFVAGGGQSRQFYIDYAAALGFTIEIVNYSAFRVGFNRTGDPVGNAVWSFVWGVRVLASSTGLGPSVLICELDAIKPAETTIILLT